MSQPGEKKPTARPAITHSSRMLQSQSVRWSLLGLAAARELRVLGAAAAARALAGSPP